MGDSENDLLNFPLVQCIYSFLSVSFPAHWFTCNQYESNYPKKIFTTSYDEIPASSTPRCPSIEHYVYSIVSKICSGLEAPKSMTDTSNFMLRRAKNRL